MQRYIAKFAITAFAIAAIATTAEARRTVIDRSDPENPMDLTLTGYCDLDGEDCDPTQLGYSVDFGQGAITDVIVYGNALLSFGPNPVALSDVSSLADYGGTVVSPGLNNELGFDDFGGDAYSLIGNVFVDPATGVITAVYEGCDTPQNCYYFNSSLVLTPTLGGYQVVATSGSTDALSGFALPDGTVQELRSGSRSFFIPARFTGLNLQSAVPEPATWAMMLIGFGAVGFSMRRKKRPRLIGSAA